MFMTTGERVMDTLLKSGRIVLYFVILSTFNLPFLVMLGLWYCIISDGGTILFYGRGYNSVWTKPDGTQLSGKRANAKTVF